MWSMAVRIVEFINGGYIRRMFASESTYRISAETIQGRKLFKGGNYSRKYGIQRKLLNFEFWIKAPKFDIQSQFSKSKIVQIFLKGTFFVIDIFR
jgi:hypothetical protein